MKRVALAFAALLFSTTGMSGAVIGHVTYVRVDNSGHGIVYFDQNITGSPACIMPTYENALAFDTNTAAGRAIMARALSAKATDDVVKASGTGACAIYGNSWSEDLLFFDFEPT